MIKGKRVLGFGCWVKVRIRIRVSKGLWVRVRIKIRVIKWFWVRVRIRIRVRVSKGF